MVVINPWAMPLSNATFFPLADLSSAGPYPFLDIYDNTCPAISYPQLLHMFLLVLANINFPTSPYDFAFDYAYFQFSQPTIKPITALNTSP
jgi:hypothetical protein